VQHFGGSTLCLPTEALTLLVLGIIKIYIKIYTKMLLHVSVYEHHQGAYT